MRRIFAFKRSRLAVVAASAYFGIEFDGAHEGNGEFSRSALDAAFGENVDLLVAMRTFEVAHVLHNSEKINAPSAEHFDGLAAVLKRNVRWSRHHHRARERDSLEKRNHHVAGTGGKIDDQVIQLTPFHLLQKLADDGVQHGSAPD